MNFYYIYAIGRQEGPIKIGISKNLGSRLTTIQTSCPFKIELIHYRTCRNEAHARRHESDIHENYREYRAFGEWFNMDWELAAEAIDCSLDTEEHFENLAREESLRVLASEELNGAH